LKVFIADLQNRLEEIGITACDGMTPRRGEPMSKSERSIRRSRPSDRIETLAFDFMTELVKGLEFAVEELDGLR
jgi:hypothetical protein